MVDCWYRLLLLEEKISIMFECYFQEGLFHYGNWKMELCGSRSSWACLLIRSPWTKLCCLLGWAWRGLIKTCVLQSNEFVTQILTFQGILPKVNQFMLICTFEIMSLLMEITNLKLLDILLVEMCLFFLWGCSFFSFFFPAIVSC